MYEILSGGKPKYALITGGTRGIGYAIAQKLAESGHDLILGYNSNRERALTSMQEIISKYSVRVFTVQGDVAKDDTINAFFDAIEIHFENRLNVLVHNAGLYIGLTSNSSSEKAKKALENPGFQVACEEENNYNMEFNAYDYYQSVYPKCFIRCLERALPLMPDGQAYVIAISSPGCSANSCPMPDYVPGPGKAVLEYLVRSYAVKLLPRRITCNCIIPGMTNTKSLLCAFFGGDEEKMKDHAKNGCPMSRLVSPDSIGDAVAFLCSPKASFITGVLLDIDGGTRFV